MTRSVRFAAAALVVAAGPFRASPVESAPEGAAREGAATASEASGTARPAATPDLSVRPQVAWLPDLYPYAEVDPAVGEQVNRLRGRRGVAMVAFAGAFLSPLVGVAITARDFAMNPLGNCTPTCAPNYTPVLIGAGVGLALFAVGAATLPKQRDVAETVALWNERHPEKPIAMTDEPQAPPQAPEPGVGPPVVAPDTQRETASTP
jgi:hypothetical protein